MDCQCDICVGACGGKPGIFLPGQVAKVAAYLGISEQQFFNESCSVDYLGRHPKIPKPVFVIMPATKSSVPGGFYGKCTYNGCVLLKDKKCSIHSVKPIECAWFDHTKVGSIEHDDLLISLADTWRNNQDEIIRLLGKVPSVNDEGSSYSAAN